MTGTSEDQPEAQPERPLLRVVKGDPTAEELAALVAVVAASASGEEPPRPPARPWSAPARGLRAPVHAGRGAWRASGLPC